MFDWKPNEIGLKSVRDRYGEDAAQALVALIISQMNYQVPATGVWCRKLAELVGPGGIFGFRDSTEIAIGLREAISVVRGQVTLEGEAPALAEAIEALSLLGLPPHPVTLLPKEPRFPKMEPI